MKQFWIFLVFFPFWLNAQLTAPDFTVTDVHGQVHHLYALLDSGKAVALDFFYTSCTACQYYAGDLQQSYQDFGCNGGEVFFLGINWGDDDLDVLQFDSAYGITYPMVSGVDGGGDSVIKSYQINQFPTLMVIDSNKHIIKVLYSPTTATTDSFFVRSGYGMHPCDTTALLPAAGKREVQVSFAPNPFRDHITLVFSGETGQGEVSIYDLSGRMLLRRRITGKRMEFDTPALGRGVYLMKVSAHGGNRVFKVVKN